MGGLAAAAERHVPVKKENKERKNSSVKLKAVPTELGCLIIKSENSSRARDISWVTGFIVCGGRIAPGNLLLFFFSVKAKTVGTIAVSYTHLTLPTIYSV